MTKIKEQKVPKWFQGEVYDTGAMVQNRFSGEEYELNALELSIYDLIMGAQMVIEMKYHGDMLDEGSAPMQKDMRKGLDWFRTHNAKAYMVLLD